MAVNNIFFILFLALSCGGFAQSGPNNGSAFSNVAIAGSTSTWTNAGNAQTSDNSYASNTTSLATNGDYTDYLKATGFGFSVPVTASMDGIVIEVERGK